jgi:hypothetical protein
MIEIPTSGVRAFTARQRSSSAGRIGGRRRRFTGALVTRRGDALADFWGDIIDECSQRLGIRAASSG